MNIILVATAHTAWRISGGCFLELGCAEWTEGRSLSGCRVISWTNPITENRRYGVEPRKRQAVANGVMEPDLAITFLTVVDRRAHLDPLLDQPPAMEIQIINLKDEAHVASRRRLARSLDALQAQPSLSGREECKLMLGIEQNRNEAERVRVPANNRRPIRDPDHCHNRSRSGGPLDSSDSGSRTSDIWTP